MIGKIREQLIGRASMAACISVGSVAFYILDGLWLVIHNDNTLITNRNKFSELFTVGKE